MITWSSGFCFLQSWLSIYRGGELPALTVRVFYHIRFCHAHLLYSELNACTGTGEGGMSEFPIQLTTWYC